jgi:hypothetical protein
MFQIVEKLSEKADFVVKVFYARFDRTTDVHWSGGY